MQLQRYTTSELIEIFEKIFYDYMSEEVNDFGDTPVSIVHNNYKENLDKYCQRIGIYTDAINNKPVDESTKRSLLKQLNYLEVGKHYIENSCMAVQKEIYAQTKSTDYCRSTIRIPLDKKINSYYDDLTLEVVFYDDVCTLKGKFDEYKELKTKSERVDFLKENTEITHMGMLYSRENNVKILIGVKGDLNTNDPRVLESGVLLLPSIFSDFKNLKLSDTVQIQNNDLKQYIQTKIDLDKENLKQLSKVWIRGDYYGIYQTPSNPEELFIRYTCRSTGRVYFNRINLNNLSLSKEYIQDDYESYCKAWWNLNTLGGEVDGKPVIRC